MSSLTLATLFIIVAVSVMLLRKRASENRQGLPLPPGPPSFPIVGNLFDMPRRLAWVTFAAMSQKYGDIMHFKVLGQDIIVISSLEVTVELLNKRASIYSDRHQSVMLTDLMETGWSFAFTNCNETWRRSRKVFNQYLGSNAIQAYNVQQFDQVQRYLRQLYLEPHRSFEHAHSLFAAILMDVIYGIQIEDGNKHVQEAVAWGQGINQVLEPGRFWVDFLPFLRYIPEWFPGAGFQKLVAGWRQNMYSSRDGPFYEVVSAYYTNGATRPSVVTTVLNDISEDSQRQEQEVTARDSLGTAFGAAVDTSVPTLQIFFFAMLTHPDVQRKAQAELDLVIGTDRLPTLKDRERLPFIDAILKETLRWIPAAPLAVPHYTSETDEYRGYHIPKGSIVLANSWKILHDPDQYPEPEIFKPERYLRPDGSLNPEVQDPNVACFGFGKRICPGRYLSENSLFLAMACTLHIFDIDPAVGPDGELCEAELHMHDHFVPHPKPFPCTFKVRTDFEGLIL